MIQFNLLPDVKLQYIKTKRLKQTMITVSLVIIAVSVAVLVVLSTSVFVFQKRHLSNVTKDIEKNKTQFEKKKDIGKVLTIQNQINSLEGMHDKKPVVSRIYGYIGQFIPPATTISNMEVDFEAHTMTITGSTSNLSGQNIFVDTLKYTTFKYMSGTPPQPSEPKNAFIGVTLDSFTPATKDKPQANYTIKLSYDPAIFESDKDVSLIVPSRVTTRSTTEKPSEEIFQKNTEEKQQ